MKKVTLAEAILGVTRDRFAILFEMQQGKIKCKKQMQNA